MKKSPKVAIVHDWLVNYSGAEKVLEQIINIYPDADLYSLVDFLPDNLRWYIRNKKTVTSFIQKLPFARKHFRHYLPLMPFAIEQLDLSEYDIIISSSFSVAKGVMTNANQLHICYCHSPMRYAWDLYQQYLKEEKLDKGIKGWLVRSVLHYIRKWDYASAGRVDYFIANSAYVARRIKKNYRRDAVIIYPPVDTGNFELVEKKEDFYLVASRMVSYKKLDIIAEAFALMPDKKLVIIGDGPDYKKIQKKAGPNVEFKGHVPRQALTKYMQMAKAFIIAADEDFGITSVEAQACGTPVIAFKKGGVRETVIDNRTGIFFDEQTAAGIREAVERFEKGTELLPAFQIRKNALRFGVSNFKEKFEAYIRSCVYEANEEPRLASLLANYNNTGSNNATNNKKSEAKTYHPLK
jgi:glycosyltransferase involved in cell wall biosynthesis